MNDETDRYSTNVASHSTIRVSQPLSRAAELLEGAISPGELVAVAQALAQIASVLWGHHTPSAGRQVWLSNAPSVGDVSFAEKDGAAFAQLPQELTKFHQLVQR